MARLTTFSEWFAKLQLNDIKFNNTLGASGYAFITEDSQYGSITTLDLDTGEFTRHLYNTTFTRPDERFNSMYNGEPIRNWNCTSPFYMTSGTNGIALASGNVYWGVKSSHRWYFISQEALIGGLTDEELAAEVQVPGNVPWSRQALRPMTGAEYTLWLPRLVAMFHGDPSSMRQLQLTSSNSIMPSYMWIPSNLRSQSPRPPPLAPPGS